MSNNSTFQVPEEYEPLGSLGSGGQASVIKVKHKEHGYFRAIRKLDKHIDNEENYFLTSSLFFAMLIAHLIINNIADENG